MAFVDYRICQKEIGIEFYVHARACVCVCFISTLNNKNAKVVFNIIKI